MSRNLLLVPLLALSAGIAALPAPPAAAQCRLCDTPTTSRDGASGDDPVSLEIETSLNFDRLILLGAGEGTATLFPNGQRSVSGMVSDLSGRALVGSAVVRGEAGRSIRIELPRRIELHSLSGGRIAIEDIISDLPAGAIQGVSLTRLGRRIYQQSVVEKEDPRGRKYYWIAGTPEWSPEEGTDHEAVSTGRVSITPLHLDLTHFGMLSSPEAWWRDL